MATWATGIPPSTPSTGQAEHGTPIDVLVNNAGITRDRMFLKMSREDWDAVIETNLNSMFNVTKQVVADMVEKGWGRIINISSVNGEPGPGRPDQLLCCQGWLHGFSMAFGPRAGHQGVTVNTVSPGYIGTDMVKAIRPDVLERSWLPFPSNAWVSPEIASIIAWLARRTKAATLLAQLLCERWLAHGLIAVLALETCPSGVGLHRQCGDCAGNSFSEQLLKAKRERASGSWFVSVWVVA